MAATGPARVETELQSDTPKRSEAGRGPASHGHITWTNARLPLPLGYSGLFLYRLPRVYVHADVLSLGSCTFFKLARAQAPANPRLPSGHHGRVRARRTPRTTARNASKLPPQSQKSAWSGVSAGKSKQNRGEAILSDKDPHHRFTRGELDSSFGASPNLRYSPFSRWNPVRVGPGNPDAQGVGLGPLVAVTASIKSNDMETDWPS